MCNKDISILSPVPIIKSHVHLSAMLLHVTCATNLESGTSPAINTITYTHQSVTSFSRRQDSSLAGPRRSCSAFWRQISTAAHRFDPAFGLGPSPGPLMVSASLSWTYLVTPFVLLSGRHRYHSRKLKFIFFKCFDFFFQCLHQVDPKGLTHFPTFRLLFSMPSSGWNQRT